MITKPGIKTTSRPVPPYGGVLLFLDGGKFRWVKAPTSAELTQLAHTIAQRVGRFLERQSLLTRDAENSYLASEAVRLHGCRR